MMSDEDMKDIDDQPAPETDELQRDMELISFNLSVIAESMEDSAHELISDSDRSAEQAGVATDSITQTAEYMDNISQNMEQVSGSVCQINGQMKEASDITHGAVSKAEWSCNAVQELNQSMVEVGEIVTLIGGFAGQTRMLAMNARIEAARAGIHGTSFAVVADEVKDLALQSAKATNKIERVIKGIRSQVPKVAESILGISETISNVNELVSCAAKATDTQTESIEKMSRDIRTASRTMLEISKNSEQVIKVSETTHVFAKNTQDLHASISEMQDIMGQYMGKSKEDGGDDDIELF